MERMSLKSMELLLLVDGVAPAPLDIALNLLGVDSHAMEEISKHVLPLVNRERRDFIHRLMREAATLVDKPTPAWVSLWSVAAPESQAMTTD